MATNDMVPSGILSDSAIRKYWGHGICIRTEYSSGPLAFNLDQQLQPGSIDLHFRSEINRFKIDDGEVLSFKRIAQKNYLSPDVIPTDKPLIIQPHEIVLTTTLENIYLSEEFAGLITGRSSFARLGLMVQCCQDFINPGLKNAVALQLINLSPYPIELDIHTPICQLIIIKMSGTPSKAYSEIKTSKYRGEKQFIPSRIDEETSNYAQNGSRARIWPRAIKFMHKYIEPLLPTVIGLLILTPFLTYTRQKSIIEMLLSVKFNTVFAIIALVVFILLRRNDD